MIRDEVGLSLDKVDGEVLGHAAKENATIVRDGTAQEAVAKRTYHIKS